MFKNLTSTQKYFYSLLLFLCVIYLGLSFLRGIPSGDETRVAGISMRMLMRGNYIVPYLNGEYFLEYPPFYYILSALAMKLFGANEWAVRLPSLLAGIIGCLVLFKIVKELKFSDLSAFLAGLFLGTSIQYFNSSKACIVDGVLSLFILSSVYCWIKIYFSQRKIYFLWLVVFLTLGVLTKGMFALAIFNAGCGAFLIREDIVQRKFHFGRYLLVAAANILALALVGIWVYALYVNTDHDLEAVKTFVITNNIGRFSGSQGDHVEGFWYYFAKLPSLFWPYLLLLPFAVYQAVKVNDNRKVLLYFLSFGFLLLLCASAKRQIYLLPLYAFAAALCAVMIGEFLHRLNWRLSKKHCLIGLGALATVYLIITLIISLRENSDRMDHFFAKIEGKNVYVLKESTPERLLGAAYFYRQKLTPEITLEQLDQLQTGDILIGRGVPKVLQDKVEISTDRCWIYRVNKQ